LEAEERVPRERQASSHEGVCIHCPLNLASAVQKSCPPRREIPRPRGVRVLPGGLTLRRRQRQRRPWGFDGVGVCRRRMVPHGGPLCVFLWPPSSRATEEAQQPCAGDVDVLRARVVLGGGGSGGVRVGP